MRLVDFFFALRPLVLIPAWSFFLLGATLSPESALPGLPLVLLSLVLSACYLVNQVIDAESDRVNDKGFFLQRRIFTPRLYLSVAVGILLVALATSLWLQASPMLLAIAAVLGLAYSIPPLRLAARPGWDLLANAAGYGGVALLLGAGSLQGIGGIEALGRAPWGARLLTSMLAVAAVFLHTTVLDVEGDRRTGKRTSGVALGVGRARGLAAACGIGGFLASLFAAAPRLQGAMLVLAPAVLVAWLFPRGIGSGVIAVGGTALFAVAAGLGTPPFLLALLLLVGLTRLYYKRRFSLSYPSLRPSAPNVPATPPRH